MTNLLLNGHFASLNKVGAFIGIDIRTNVPNFPQASYVVALLKAHLISHVRLYDADARMLRALANTTIEVMAGVTNDQLPKIGESTTEAAEWINKNVASFAPETNITAIAVGNDVLTKIPHAAHVLVPAMQRLHLALVESNLNSKIKVSTPLPMDIVSRPFPPSTAVFDPSWNVTMKMLLQFLKNTNSYFLSSSYFVAVFLPSNCINPDPHDSD